MSDTERLYQDALKQLEQADETLAATRKAYEEQLKGVEDRLAAAKAEVALLKELGNMPATWLDKIQALRAEVSRLKKELGQEMMSADTLQAEIEHANACADESLREKELAEAEVERLKAELKTSADMLAKQCDVIRQEGVRVAQMKADGEAIREKIMAECDQYCDDADKVKATQGWHYVTAMRDGIKRILSQPHPSDGPLAQLRADLEAIREACIVDTQSEEPKPWMCQLCSACGETRESIEHWDSCPLSKAHPGDSLRAEVEDLKEQLATEKALRMAILHGHTGADLLKQAADYIGDTEGVPPNDWWKRYFMFTGEHMILTDEGWEPAEAKASYLKDDPDWKPLDEINARRTSRPHPGDSLRAEVEHPEDKCEKCGGPNICWCCDSPLWNEVARSRGRGILCPICFVKMAQEHGYPTATWKLVIESDEDLARVAEMVGLRAEVERLRGAIKSKAGAAEIVAMALVERLKTTGDGSGCEMARNIRDLCHGARAALDQPASETRGEGEG